MNPSKYGWLTQYYDEVYLCFNTIIQQHYIRCYGNIPFNNFYTFSFNLCNFICVQFIYLGGSLAEVFYSLSRIHSKSEQISTFDKCSAFTLVVIVPYISSKLSNLVNKWDDYCENGIYDVKEYQRKQKLIRAYKFVKGAFDCFQIVQYVGYLSDRSKTHSILNRIIGQHLVYLSAEMNLNWTWSDLFSMNFQHSAVLTGMIFRALELSAFFLQFIQWWQNETSNGSLIKLPNPKPPGYEGKNSAASVRYRNICPICLQKWRIPTVNRVSG